MSNFRDIQKMHDKLGLSIDRPQVPRLLNPEYLQFRLGFLIEELGEYAEAHGALRIADQLKLLAVEARSCTCYPRRCDLPLAADALVDLSVVTLGTADFMGIPWEACWDEVWGANMAKVRAAPDGSDSKRNTRLDLIKPEGWKPPDIAAILKRYI